MWKKLRRLLEGTESGAGAALPVDDADLGIRADMVVEIIAITGSPDIRLGDADILQLYKGCNPSFSEFQAITSMRTSVDIAVELEPDDLESLLDLVDTSDRGSYLGSCTTIVQTLGVQTSDPEGNPKSVPIVFLTYFGNSPDPAVLVYPHPREISFTY